MQNNGLGCLAFKPQFWVNEVTRFGFDLVWTSRLFRRKMKQNILIGWVLSIKPHCQEWMPSRSFSGHDIYMYCQVE